MNQTFVVTVLTTIFVSDFPLLTKILTDFVHPPTLISLLGTKLKNFLFSHSHPLTTVAKTALAPSFPNLSHAFTKLEIDTINYKKYNVDKLPDTY